ncbi:MAG TPA: hypothetical protein VG184_03035 [Acidimicrobiales bacterium]|nr:hypothetical protein [Acidimicrobiales bacterium]
MGADAEKPPPSGEDPFERLVLNEEFVKSASISESAAAARRRTAKISRRRRFKARLRRLGRRRRRPGRSGAESPAWSPSARPAARRPPTARLPDWTPRQWAVTLIVALGVVAYLYFGLGGPT